VVAAGLWPCHTSVHRAARRFLRQLDPTVLLLWDAGFHSYDWTAAVRGRAGALLARVPATQTFQPLVRLSDGTMLALFYAAPPTRRTATTPRMLVRVLTYTVPDPAHPGHRHTYRLMTTLLAPRRYPAEALLLGYHERWEIELVFDEQKTHQRVVTTPFRSRTPRGVVQEFYGLLLAHYAVRAMMHEAALAADCDPDRLSFARALRVLAAQVSYAAGLDPVHWQGRRSALLRVIAAFRLPPRQNRRAPRERKRSWPKHGLRQRTPAYAIQRVPPFLDTVVLAAVSLPHFPDALPLSPLTCSP
jgi:hypothetical protein